VVPKEENLVLLDGAADEPAEFVLVIDGFGLGEEASRVQGRVAEVLERRAMERVGSRFQNVVLDALPLVLGLGAVGLDLELVHRIHRDGKRQISGVALRSRAG